MFKKGDLVEFYNFNGDGIIHNIVHFEGVKKYRIGGEVKDGLYSGGGWFLEKEFYLLNN